MVAELCFKGMWAYFPLGILALCASIIQAEVSHAAIINQLEPHCHYSAKKSKTVWEFWLVVEHDFFFFFFTLKKNCAMIQSWAAVSVAFKGILVVYDLRT